MCSDWTMYQLKEFDSHPLKTRLFEEMKNNDKFLYVEVIEDDKKMAARFDTDYEDAVHACIAMRNGASYLVTRNVTHFGCFHGDTLKIIFPEHAYLI